MVYRKVKSAVQTRAVVVAQIGEARCIPRIAHPTIYIECLKMVAHVYHGIAIYFVVVLAAVVHNDAVIGRKSTKSGRTGLFDVVLLYTELGATFEVNLYGSFFIHKGFKEIVGGNFWVYIARKANGSAAVIKIAVSNGYFAEVE